MVEQTIHNSTFKFNGPLKNTSYGGGGLRIEFPYCSPKNHTVCSIMPDSEYNSDAVYEISNCVFEGNRAVANAHRPSHLDFLPPNPETYSSTGYGGGLSVHFCKASNVFVEIHNTAFVSNSASYGGGISCSFEEYSVNNTVVVHGSNIGLCSIGNNSGLAAAGESGSVGYGAGGGLRVVFWFSSVANNNHNTLNVTNCLFSNNVAYYGGATLVKASPETTQTEPTNSLVFTDCEWIENSGYFGGVALITTYDEALSSGALLKPTFKNCTVLGNNGNLVVSRVPIAFQISIQFLGNANVTMSSAILTVDDATVEFHDGCNALFLYNKAHYGGAITLYGHAFLRVFPNTEFVFENNFAIRDGGAIYQSVSQPQLLQNGPCFIQYHDRTVPPSKWNTSFHFDSNRENVRTTNPVCNSILLGSVLPCMWEGYEYRETQSEEVLKRAICLEWGNVLEFISTDCRVTSCDIDTNNICNNCTQHIRTKPSRMRHSEQSLIVTPGIPAPLGLILVDDLGSNVSYESVLNVWTNDRRTMSLPPETFYLTGDQLEMYGRPNTSSKLAVDTLPPRQLFTTIDISFIHCPPGFKLNSSSEGEEILPHCVCRSGLRWNRNCLPASRLLDRQASRRLQPLLVGRTAYIHSTAFLGTLRPKTGYLNSSYLNDVVCGPLHREGTLCGKCKDGFTPRLHGYTLNSCVECHPHDWYGWSLVLVLELVPVTIVLVVVLIFNISATSGAMNFFVFFAQVITNSFSVDPGGYIGQGPGFFKLLSHIYNSMYSLWTLEIKIPDKWCYTHPIPTPEVFLLVYGKALYTLFLIFLFLLFVKLHDHGVQPFYCCGKWLYEKLRRFRKPWTVQRSVIHALATFLVLSFTKIMQASFMLIAPSLLMNHAGDIIQLVPLYYGHRSTSVYLIFALVAVVFLTSFVLVPMLLLLILPIKTRLARLTFEKLFRKCCIDPNNTKLQMFLKVFRGSFKDGSGSKDELDCQKFAGFYLFLRFIIFMLAALFPAAEFLLGQQIVVVFAMVMFAIYQPYREKLYNIVDVLAFAMLATINSITIYHEVVATMGQPMSLTLLALQYFMVFLPLLILTVVVLWKTAMYFFGTKYGFCNRVMRTRRRGETDTNEEFVAFVQATRERDGER